MKKYLLTLLTSCLLLESFLTYGNNLVPAQETKPKIFLHYKDRLINNEVINDHKAYKIYISLANYPKANAVMISDKPNFEGAKWENITYLCLELGIWQRRRDKNNLCPLS